MSDTIRVLIVDDHAVVRRGLMSFLQVLEGIESAGEAADADEALTRLREADRAGDLPQVVLLDLKMAGMDGIALTSVIGRRFPTVRSIVMTAFPDVRYVRQALAAGASGYVLKDASPGEVEAAIRAAVRGELFLDPAVARTLATAPRRDEGPELLSVREQEVLGLVGAGLTNREIADHLVISERTARTHVSNILAKLNLTSRTQAALFAAREGLAPPSGGL